MAEETPETKPSETEELQKQIDDLNAREQALQQQQQATFQQVQGRLQQDTAAMIQTRGQIALLGELLVTQTAAVHRDEGMLQALQNACTPSNNG